ncbi:MAG: hypothetical protein LBC20_10495 [Planctomycetaceae bacterium]|jgi:hypothetical protein|nr:hypothetical protein [Planctomycetaceae bacterium]
MNKYLLFQLLCLTGLIFLAGCKENISVFGKVVFPDGKPLQVGTVCFQNDTVVATGDLQSDGSFHLGLEKKGSGISSGLYQIYISGAQNIENTPPPKDNPEGWGDPIVTPLIHRKFMSPQTSGLSCDVVKGMKLPYNITVEYP